MRKTLKTTLTGLILGSIALTGCAWVSSSGITPWKPGHYLPSDWLAALIQVEVVSVMTTKKTLSDHVATWVTGKDCSAVKAEQDGVWCRDWPPPAPPPPAVYCYATWARPNCFAQPYTQGNDRLIGFVPAPTPQH